MALEVKHEFVSAVADESDPDKVGPDEWNAAHNLTGTANRLVGLDASGDGGEVTVGTGLALSALALSLSANLQLWHAETPGDYLTAAAAAAAYQPLDSVLTNTTASFTTADADKLDGIEAGATADQSGAEIAAAIDIENTTARTAFASGDKLLIWESGVGNRQIDYDDLPGAGGGLANIVEDTTPQLGGDLDLNGHVITGLVIGTDVQAFDAGLAYLAGLTITDESTFKTAVNLEIGVDVAAYDADALFADVGDTLDAGFVSADYAHGTVTSGTVTPAPGTGQENFQTLTNGGAFTLAPPASSCTVVMHVTNNGSAGAITTSGFTVVTGDMLTTTDTHEFIFYITKIGTRSQLHVTALQ